MAGYKTVGGIAYPARESLDIMASRRIVLTILKVKQTKKKHRRKEANRKNFLTYVKLFRKRYHTKY